MYVFVFMWTPALTKLTPGLQLSDSDHRRYLADSSSESGATLPFGLIFSTFMVCCMAGSSTFSLAMEKRVTLETFALVILAAASSAMALIAFSSNSTLTFVAMNIFEMTVGMYFPTMGTLKSAIVPETSRAAIYNLYRIPLNFIVLTSLLTKLSVTTSFIACALMLGAATFLQFQLKTLRGKLALARSKAVMDIQTQEMAELGLS
jgi:multisubunit Na+/H+ antiporter MnhC subunit